LVREVLLMSRVNGTPLTWKSKLVIYGKAYIRNKLVLSLMYAEIIQYKNNLAI
jgi:hypothetical protein